MPSEVEPTEDLLFWQDEILQAMFWMTKEGIEDRVGPETLQGFLDAPDGVVERALDRLDERGFLEATGTGHVFTDEGERQAKRLFAEAFHDIQGFDTSHTNCSPDCWCHDVDKAEEPCPSEHDHDHDHVHDHGHGDGGSTT